MLVSCVCCVLCRWRPLRRDDHSFIGVLPGFVCVCVCVCVCLIACSVGTSKIDYVGPIWAVVL